MDPRKIIETRPMSRFQWSVVVIMVGLLALDGFDVLSISFAAPGISDDWGIDRGVLGVIMSMELIGMAVGAFIFGWLADSQGRRATILICLVILTIGMLGASTASGIYTLSAWRIGTGLGIGGMLAATNAATAEVTNNRFRMLCVTLMATGYPIGNVIGGSVAAQILVEHDWRAIFRFGGAVTLLFIPIVWFGAPESISFLMHKRPADALAKVNRVLKRMGFGELDRLPDEEAPAKKARMADLVKGAYTVPTLTLTAVYFTHLITFYFILKWIPKIVVDLGYEPSAAAGVLVWASVGGFLGSVTLGLLTLRFRAFHLTVAALFLSALFVVWFGQTNQNLGRLSLAACAAGFATNAAIVGLYGLIAATFPTALRATATGVIVGFARGGSILAPALAGFLFVLGFTLSWIAAAMAMGSLIAGLLLFAFFRHSDAA